MKPLDCSSFTKDGSMKRAGSAFLAVGSLRWPSPVRMARGWGTGTSRQRPGEKLVRPIENGGILSVRVFGDGRLGRCRVRVNRRAAREIALDDCERLLAVIADPGFPGDERAGIENQIVVEHVRDRRKAELLGLDHGRRCEYGRVDHPALKRSQICRLRPGRQDRRIRLRIEPGFAQDVARDEIRRRAELADADLLALEIGDGVDRRRGIDLEEQLFGSRDQDYDVAAVEIGADDRVLTGIGERRVARKHSGNESWALRHELSTRGDAVFLEESLVDRDPERRHADADGLERDFKLDVAFGRMSAPRDWHQSRIQKRSKQNLVQ